MLDIPINNPEILETLNKFLWFYDEREGEIAKCKYMVVTKIETILREINIEIV